MEDSREGGDLGQWVYFSTKQNYKSRDRCGKTWGNDICQSVICKESIKKNRRAGQDGKINQIITVA